MFSHELVSVVLDSFLDGVAYCVAKHVKSQDYLTSTGKTRKNHIDISLFEGNVYYSPPTNSKNVEISFSTPEDAMVFINSLQKAKEKIDLNIEGSA